MSVTSEIDGRMSCNKCDHRPVPRNGTVLQGIYILIYKEIFLCKCLDIRVQSNAILQILYGLVKKLTTEEIQESVGERAGTLQDFT